jgi:hypothetical protein
MSKDILNILMITLLTDISDSKYTRIIPVLSTRHYVFGFRKNNEFRNHAERTACDQE